MRPPFPPRFPHYPVLALVLVLVTGPRAAAIGTRTGDILVNTYTTGPQTSGNVAVHDEEGFVVIWFGHGQDASEAGVRARRFGWDGTALGSELPVNTYGTGTQYSPTVTMDGQGDFVAAWVTEGQDGDGQSIRARMFASNGVATTGELAVNTYTPADQCCPQIAMRGGSEFVLTWHSGDGTEWDRRFRRFSGTGAPLTADVLLDTNRAAGGGLLVDDATGAMTIGWWDNPARDPFFSRYTSSGTPLAGPFQVNTYTFDFQTSPYFASDDDGNFVAVWRSTAEGGAAGTDVKARRFSSSGAALSAEFRLNNVTAGSQDFPKIAMAPDGHFVAVWHGPDAGGAIDVIGREFSHDGTPLGAEERLNAWTTSWQGWPEVEMDPSGRFVVTWSGATAGDPDPTVARVFATDRIFADEFEHHGTGHWRQEVDPDGDLSVTTQAGLNGTVRGMQLVIDDTQPLYVVDLTPQNEFSYRARFYLDPNGLQMGTDGDRMKVLQLFADEPTSRRVVTLVLRQLGGQYYLLGKAHQDDDSWVNTGLHPISNAPHVVEIRYFLPLIFGGRLELFIDGVSVSTVTDLDNSLGDVDWLRWGAISVKPGASGTLFLDLFESRRETYIGP